MHSPTYKAIGFMTGNPTQIAEKWARNLGTSTDSIRQGVQAVQISPTEKAARQSDAYLQGVQAAVSSGKYAAGLRKVTLQDWQNAMINKGINRIASGAAASKGKVQDFLTKFLPHVEAGQRMLESMPRGGLDQNIARAVAMMQHNARFSNT